MNATINYFLFEEKVKTEKFYFQTEKQLFNKINKTKARIGDSLTITLSVKDEFLTNLNLILQGNFNKFLTKNETQIEVTP